MGTARDSACEQEILAAADAVQRRIAHDLHDGLGQLLVGAALMAQGLVDQAPAALRSDITRLVDTLNEATSRMQSIARGLSPLRLGRLTVSEALGSVCAATHSTLGVECTLQIDPAAERQSETTTVQVCLIAQEAISNAVRHGGATRLQLQLVCHERQFTLSIRDNGTGFPLDGSNRGIGLESMHHRASVLGGSIEITNLESEGTLVRCVWSGDHAGNAPALTP